MKKIILFTAVLAGGLSFTSYAQNDNKIENTKRGHVSFSYKNSDAQSRVASTDRGAFLRQELELTSQDEVRKLKEESDNIGFSHERFQQYFNGVKVEHANIVAHSTSGRVAGFNGEFFDIPSNFVVKASLSESAALQSAIRFTGAKKYMWEQADADASAKIMNNGQSFLPKGELVIIKDFTEQENLHLAYKFDIYASYPVSRNYVYIDAKSGEVVNIDAIIKHADAVGSAETAYSGTRTITTDSFNGSYRLRETGRGLGIETYNMRNGGSYTAAVDFTDNDNTWGLTEHATNSDNVAHDAHWGAESTYDYWKNVHGRNSYDNAGAKIKSYVHTSLIAMGYPDNQNAFWNGSVMTYGDGGSRFRPLTALDVCGHEIGHAVCSNTANLAYQKESGAMNEGFSDIWGACIEYYKDPTKQTWLIGEDIDKSRPSLRSMSNPNAEGQPDTYGGTYWKSVVCTPSSSNDQCGVHTNSGVLNYWFYLLTVGGSGTNDISNVFSVTGIGIDKAAKIAYRLESVYLTASSTFANARTYGIKSAEDLYGVGSAEALATTNAWYAVGVGAAGGTTPPPTVTYCASKGNSVADEWIGKVVFGSISNTSGKNAGYGNFTAQSTNVAKGSAYTITITPSWTSTKYNEGYSVWIDYNKDGDFLDSGEQVATQAATTATSIAKSFTIPTTAATGATRMRVSMKYNGIPTSCEAFSYGEVEDYTVNIGTTAFSTGFASGQQLEDTQLAIYPNPAYNTLNISSDSELKSVKLFSITGAEVGNVQVNTQDKFVNISQLSKGIYLVNIETENGTTRRKFVKE
jgi:bacillolysin